jgi:hypothetical protein
MDLYEVLGVARDATPDQIKRAYRRKSKAAHPDTGGNTEEFRALVLARDVLTDEEKRRTYDETGALPGDKNREAIECILRISAQLVAENPRCDILRGIRLSLDNSTQQASRNIASLEIAIKGVTENWTGAELVKDSLLVEWGRTIVVLRKMIETYKLATELLKSGQFRQPQSTMTWATAGMFRDLAV